MGDEKNSESNEITKASHCVSNPKVYWCSNCKAHNPSDYSVSYSYNSDGRRTAYEKMGCQICGASMFCPAETMPWMYGLSAFTLTLPVLGWSFRHTADGILECSIGLAAFSGLIGGMMIFHMRKRFTWSLAQKRKSPEQLEMEARKYISLANTREASYLKSSKEDK